MGGPSYNADLITLSFSSYMLVNTGEQIYVHVVSGKF